MTKIRMTVFALVLALLPLASVHGQVVQQSFGFNAARISGFPSGAALLTGGGAYNLERAFLKTGGGFRCKEMGLTSRSPRTCSSPPSMRRRTCRASRTSGSRAWGVVRPLPISAHDMSLSLVEMTTTSSASWSLRVSQWARLYATGIFARGSWLR